MAADTKPILLRPSCALADAMARAAEEYGISRQAWMLEQLENAAAEWMPRDQHHPDDVPLPLDH